jgi:hypothetical protein
MLPSDIRKLKALAKQSGSRALSEHIEEAERNSAFAEELIKALEEVEDRRSKTRRG